jgi:three-Cys-motif partner protein
LKKSHSENAVGPWARQKLDGLESYLSAYTTALSKQRFRLVFIDAFAGAGKSRVREAWSGLDESEIQLFEDETIAQGEEEFIEGSPRRALSIRRPFHSYHFFDADAARAGLLRDLRGEFSDREIDVRVGDANQLVQALAPTLQGSRTKAVAFLDPYGPHLHWRTVEILAGTKNVEVIINLPLAMAINRLITRSGDVPDSWRRSLNACFGNDEWYRMCYREQGDLFGRSSITKVDDAAARLLNYYAGRLKTIFGHVATPSVVRNTRGMPIYYILWAGPNTLGLKIADHVLKQGEKVRRPRR